jgi:hypothetical protein
LKRGTMFSQREPCTANRPRRIGWCSRAPPATIRSVSDPDSVIGQRIRIQAGQNFPPPKKKGKMKTFMFEEPERLFKGV